MTDDQEKPVFSGSDPDDTPETDASDWNFDYNDADGYVPVENPGEALKSEGCGGAFCENGNSAESGGEDAYFDSADTVDFDTSEPEEITSATERSIETFTRKTSGPAAFQNDQPPRKENPGGRAGHRPFAPEPNPPAAPFPSSAGTSPAGAPGAGKVPTEIKSTYHGYGTFSPGKPAQRPVTDVVYCTRCGLQNIVSGGGQALCARCGQILAR